MLTKKDYYLAALTGFLTGIFAVPTFLNLGIKSFKVLILLPFAAAVVFLAGLRLAAVLGKILKFLTQFGKFAEVGFLNTAIDFGVLNILSMLTGVTAGFIVGGVNIPGVGLAMTNSYFWNKFWVFKTGQEKQNFKDIPTFVAVSILGILINSGIVVLMTTYFHPLFGVKTGAWLNLAKSGATVISLIWNFVGYKFVVFRKNV